MEAYEIKHKNKFIAETEISTLKEWFRKYYTEHEQKYRRLHFLGITDDDGVEGKIKLAQLYEEAETKRKRIQELETLISETRDGDTAQK